MMQKFHYLPSVAWEKHQFHKTMYFSESWNFDQKIGQSTSKWFAVLFWNLIDRTTGPLFKTQNKINFIVSSFSISTFSTSFDWSILFCVYFFFSVLVYFLKAGGLTRFSVLLQHFKLFIWNCQNQCASKIPTRMKNLIKIRINVPLKFLLIWKI